MGQHGCVLFIFDPLLYLFIFLSLSAAPLAQVALHICLTPDDHPSHATQI